MLNAGDRISTLGRDVAVKPLRKPTRTPRPRIRLVTPRPGFTVSSDVFVLVDAASEMDDTGSLKVEIQVGGEKVLTAKYSTASGYYGAIWDAREERSGSIHTLIARVTDSQGATSSTLGSVRIG